MSGYEKEIGMWKSEFQSSYAVTPVLVLLERERQGKEVLGLSGECSGLHTKPVTVHETWIKQATGFLGKRICCL